MGLLIWVEPLDFQGFKTLLIAYFISQVILSITTAIWASLQSGKFAGDSNFQKEIEKNNVAVAVDFFGRRIATALAINIATVVLAYQSLFDIPILLKDWLLACMMSIFLLQIFVFFASRVIIGGHREASKKIAEGDVATALISAATYISFGFLISQIIV
jgi:uncharacterized membrane protein YjfL (UPF0719 family)